VGRFRGGPRNVSQAGAVAWLALRELWMSFRPLVVLVVTVGAGAVVVLLPASPAVTVGRLAVGLGLATVVTAAAAWSVPEPVLPDALRAAGIGLALSSALLVAARATLERTDL
jgi:hypothetical protein